MEILIDILKTLLYSFVTITLILLVVTPPVYLLKTYECNTYEQTTNVETKMSGFKCYYKTNGAWLTENERLATIVSTNK